MTQILSFTPLDKIRTKKALANANSDFKPQSQHDSPDNTAMRLSPDQVQAIRQTAHRVLGEGAAIWLFGSRLDDHVKGGDVDLYVEAQPHPLMDEIRCKVELEESLDLPVDLIVRPPLDSSLIAQIAKTQGARL